MDNTQTDVMIDIETLGTVPDSVILTIGAIKFNRYDDIKKLKNYDTFYVRVCPKSCKKIGSVIDKKTLEWWKQQGPEEKYEALENPDRIDITSALKKLSKWIGPNKYIWANSPSFDCVILESSYARCGIKVPWQFWKTRDCRTLFDISKNYLQKDIHLYSDNLNKHNALNDCYIQLCKLKNSFKNI